MAKSPPERAQCAISHPYEREAITLLWRAGWTRGELRMAFQVSDGALNRLLAAEGVLDE